MFFKKNASAPSGKIEYIVAGLGNPGTKYEGTRHNVGFTFVDTLAEKHGLKVNKLKFKSLYADAVINGHRVLVMKPQTFMNESGQAIREAASFYKIPPQNIIIVFDDISLEPGRLRIRKSGSDGGHNGIKSIIYSLSSDSFPRVNIGVGAKPHPDYDLAAWVLSGFGKEDAQKVSTAIDNAVSALSLMLDGKTDEAMNLYNKR